MKYLKTFEIFSPIPMWIASGMFNANRNQSSPRRFDDEDPSPASPIKKALIHNT